MSTNYDIIIVGAGWYGCHIASILQEKFKVLILDKENDLFSKSSYFNQNRLHLGFHYSRDYETRNLCQKYYDKFKDSYPECIEEINNNYYAISNNSIICNKTYLSIFRHEDFDFIYDKNNTIFKNIQGYPIKVEEKVINSEKAKQIFKNKLIKCNCLFNTEVKDIKNIDKKILINDKFSCKILLDCTYNQLNLSIGNYLYEITLSLLYKKNKDFGAITIVDGDFCSLYPRYDNIYTLTDVEHTQIAVSNNFNDIKNYTPKKDEIEDKKNKMENKIKFYFKE